MIRIASGDEFKRLVEALAIDVGDANIHWRLYKGLHEKLGEGERVVWHQAQTFWSLTLKAHVNTAVQCLARAFDQNQTSLHLLSLLKTIQSNLDLFSMDRFKMRLAGNPFVDSLAEHPRTPDMRQLDQDIALCTDSDLRVRSLILHRGNVLAHRNAKTVASGRNPAEQFGMMVEDFEVLLDRAHDIVNRYSNLFIATTYSRQMLGHDDYQYIVSCVDEAARRSRDEVAASLAFNRTCTDKPDHAD